MHFHALYDYMDMIMPFNKQFTEYGQTLSIAMWEFSFVLIFSALELAMPQQFQWERQKYGKIV